MRLFGHSMGIDVWNTVWLDTGGIKVNMPGYLVYRSLMTHSVVGAPEHNYVLILSSPS
jgi:hypothetical protein